MSSEVTQFVNSLLATSPRAPHSVHLDIDVDGDVAALFEVLLLTMTEMLKHWYEPPITISKISDVDLERMIDYFASFGIRFQLETAPEPPVLRIHNREYLQQSRLEQMKFQIAHENRLYTVRFSNLPTA
jgi:hypothetical protein